MSKELGFYRDVHAFHRRGGVACPQEIEFPDQQTIDLRKRLNTEEVSETNDALDARDMVEAADGIIDSIYVLLGNAIALGIPEECFTDLWDEVQRANMSKFVFDEATCKWTVYKDAEGKITKPPGWRPPDIKGVLRWHGWKGEVTQMPLPEPPSEKP